MSQYHDAMERLSQLCAEDIAKKKSSILALLPWERAMIEEHEETVCEDLRIIAEHVRDLEASHGAWSAEARRLAHGEEIDLGDEEVEEPAEEWDETEAMERFEKAQDALPSIPNDLGPTKTEAHKGCSACGHSAPPMSPEET